MLFERLAHQPAYRQVSTAIEDKILRRTLRPGDMLPTESELARQFGVNRSTVREALRRLESSGLVDRLNGGKRLFVTRPGSAETVSRVSRALALDEVTFIELWEAMLAIAPRTAALAAALWCGQAQAASATCEKSADDKKLSGAARTSHIKKCEADAGTSAACEKSAADKNLAGAARTSHIKKCMEDGGADPGAACEKSAADRNLAGAAKTSHVKKCMEDAARK